MLQQATWDVQAQDDDGPGGSSFDRKAEIPSMYRRQCYGAAMPRTLRLCIGH